MARKPPFPNDDHFTKQIEAKIEPNRQFPFVQLKSLVKEQYSASLTPKKGHKILEKRCLKCHICSEKFDYQFALSYHLGQKHPEVDKPFACSLCPEESFKTSNELNLHLGTKHSDQYKLIDKGYKIFATIKKLQCPHCPMRFTGPTYLNRHVGSHTNERLNVCDGCGSKYRHLYELQKHKLNKKCSKVIEQKITRQFKCDHCSATMKCKKILQSHLLIFHGIKAEKKTKSDLTCLFCGYKAPNGTVLVGHNRIHSGEKPFECKACKRAFTLKGNLTAHIRLHCPAAKAMGLEPDITPTAKATHEEEEKNAEGRFKCSLCARTVKHLFQKKLHEKTHGDKHKCDLCPTGFNSHVGLLQHKVKEHKIYKTKLTDCLDCGAAGFSKDRLKIHRWVCPERNPIKKSTLKEDNEGDQKLLDMDVNFRGQSSPLKDDKVNSTSNQISSWVQSVTNSKDPVALAGIQSHNCTSSFNDMPITVLKMEH